MSDPDDARGRPAGGAGRSGARPACGCRLRGNSNRQLRLVTWIKPSTGSSLKPAEEAEILDLDDDRVEGLADLILQVGEQLHPDQLAFGGLGPSLGARAVLAQDDQLVMPAARLLPLDATRSTGDGPAGRDSGGSAR